MKFSKNVLGEIVRLVQNGMLLGKDISQDLREIDVVPDDPTGDIDCEVDLSARYISNVQKN